MAFGYVLLVALISQPGPAAAVPESKPGEYRLAVELSDGSKVVGVPSRAALTLETALGKLDIPVELLRRVQAQPNGETVVAIFANRDQLTGSLSGEPLVLDTLLGKVTVPLPLVRAIQVLAPGGKPISSRGMILHLPMDEDNAEVAHNQMADQHHAQVRGATWTAEGRVGGGYHFRSGYLEIADAADLNRQEFTLAAWVYPEQQESIGSWRGIAVKTSTGSWDDGYGLAQYPGMPNLKFFTQYYSSHSAGVEIPVTGQWHHLAATYAEGVGRLYHNGQLASEYTTTSAGGAAVPLRHSSGPLLIGSAPSTYQYHGKIDEVILFDHALSAAAIADLYASYP